MLIQLPNGSALEHGANCSSPTLVVVRLTLRNNGSTAATCPSRCGITFIPAPQPAPRPALASPWRCGTHQEQPVNWRGKGCPECARPHIFPATQEPGPTESDVR